MRKSKPVLQRTLRKYSRNLSNIVKKPNARLVDFLLRYCSKNIKTRKTHSSLNIHFVASPNLHRDSGMWWKTQHCHWCTMLRWFFFFFWWMLDCAWTCFTGTPLKAVMSSFGQPCHSPGGVLCCQGVIFKMLFTETQMIECNFLHLQWRDKTLWTKATHHSAKETHLSTVALLRLTLFI